jgi:hypothetical protein
MEYSHLISGQIRLLYIFIISSFDRFRNVEKRSDKYLEIQIGETTFEKSINNILFFFVII